MKKLMGCWSLRLLAKNSGSFLIVLKMYKLEEHRCGKTLTSGYSISLTVQVCKFAVIVISFYLIYTKLSCYYVLFYMFSNKYDWKWFLILWLFFFLCSWMRFNISSKYFSSYNSVEVKITANLSIKLLKSLELGNEDGFSN